MITGSKAGIVALLSRTEPAHYVIRDCRSATALEITLPDHASAPSCFTETFEIALIPGDVRRELLVPEFRPCCWNSSISAPFMPVPEAAMNENHSPPARKNDIRSAG